MQSYCSIYLAPEKKLFSTLNYSHFQEYDAARVYPKNEDIGVNLGNKGIGITHLLRTQNFPETNISYLLIRTRTCADQGVGNVSSLENFAYALNDDPISYRRVRV